MVRLRVMQGSDVILTISHSRPTNQTNPSTPTYPTTPTLPQIETVLPHPALIPRMA